MLHGVIRGGYFLNQERTQELDNRIYQRNLPSQEMQMTFSPRPTQTRTMLFPVLNSHMPTLEGNNIKQINNYNINSQFNPGTYSPYSGYMNSIDNESRIRNQFFANQPAVQSKYIPSSLSDLYKYDIQQEIIKNHKEWNAQEIPQLEQPASDISVPQPYPCLFERQQFSDFNPNEYEFGKDVFSNHTRQQIKNLNISYNK